MNPPFASRLPQLDVLRGIAVLMVLGAHPAAKLDDSGCFWPLAYPWSFSGWTGVNLFFVLSGFLVGGLLFAEMRATDRLSPVRFIVRRMFKIWPSYYVFLFVLTGITARAGVDPGILWPYFFHVQNYLGTGVVGSHTWSLAVEEHFYLLLPLVLSLTRSPRVLVPLLIASVVGCAVSRGMSQAVLPAMATHHCFDSLGFGVLLAYFYHFRPAEFRRLSSRPVPLTLGGLVFVGLGLWSASRGSVLADTIVPIWLYLGYGMILVAMLGYSTDRGLSARFFGSLPARLLVLVGIYSYSIYLWHIDVAYRLTDLLGRAGVLADASPSVRWPMLTTGYVLLAIGGGVLFGRCVELPALALRDRLVPRRDLSRAGGSGCPEKSCAGDGFSASCQSRTTFGAGASSIPGRSAYGVAVRSDE